MKCPKCGVVATVACTNDCYRYTDCLERQLAAKDAEIVALKESIDEGNKVEDGLLKEIAALKAELSDARDERAQADTERMDAEAELHQVRMNWDVALKAELARWKEPLDYGTEGYTLYDLVSKSHVSRVPDIHDLLTIDTNIRAIRAAREGGK